MFDARDFETYFVGGLIAVAGKSIWKPRKITELLEVEDQQEGVYHVSVRTLGREGKVNGDMLFSPFFSGDDYIMFPPSFGYCNSPKSGEAFWCAWNSSDRHRKLVTPDSLSLKAFNLFPTADQKSDSIKAIFNPEYYSFDEAARRIWNKESTSVAVNPHTLVRLTKHQSLPVIEYLGVPAGWLNQDGIPDTPSGLSFNSKRYANYEVI